MGVHEHVVVELLDGAIVRVDAQEKVERVRGRFALASGEFAIRVREQLVQKIHRGIDLSLRIESLRIRLHRARVDDDGHLVGDAEQRGELRLVCVFCGSHRFDFREHGFARRLQARAHLASLHRDLRLQRVNAHDFTGDAEFDEFAIHLHRRLLWFFLKVPLFGLHRESFRNDEEDSHAQKAHDKRQQEPGREAGQRTIRGQEQTDQRNGALQKPSGGFCLIQRVVDFSLPESEGDDAPGLTDENEQRREPVHGDESVHADVSGDLRRTRENDGEFYHHLESEIVEGQSVDPSHGFTSSARLHRSRSEHVRL